MDENLKRKHQDVGTLGTRVLRCHLQDAQEEAGQIWKVESLNKPTKQVQRKYSGSEPNYRMVKS